MTAVYPWCCICQSTAVLHRGDACGGCMGDLEAMLDPIVRPANPPRPKTLRLRLAAILKPREIA